MPLAITTRPDTWDQIVGQGRALRVLRSLLSAGRFTPPGMIMDGPTGVGKTTTAFLAAKALMCTGGEPLGCGKCPSCGVFQDNPLQHPDFSMFDGASNSGVEASRRIVDASTDLPALGRVRVVIVDEAHRLSSEAFDVYLIPLEARARNCTFIFCTTNLQKIPATVRGRCSRFPFYPVPADELTGKLVTLAVQQGIEFELEGIRAIALASKGRVRDAIYMLDDVRRMGKVTKELVGTVSDVSVADNAMAVLIHVVAKRFVQACDALAALAQQCSSSPKAIEEVFSAYARAVFGEEGTSEEDQRRHTAVRVCLPNHTALTSVLLKWSAAERIPTDALPLFLHELSQHVVVPESTTPVAPPPVVLSTPALPVPVPVPPPASGVMSIDDL